MSPATQILSEIYEMIRGGATRGDVLNELRVHIPNEDAVQEIFSGICQHRVAIINWTCDYVQFYDRDRAPELY